MMRSKKWRLLLFGEAKTGKTSLAETAPGPRLILDAEGGTTWLASNTVEWNPLEGGPPKDLDPDVSVVVSILNWEMLERINTWLQKGGHEFKSVILDSLTELQKQAKRSITDTGMTMKDWGTLYDRMDPVLRELRDLTQVPGSPVECVVLVCLANSREDRIVPDVQGSMARSLAGQVDTIGYLRVGQMNADGGQDRELLVDARQGISAGDRTKVLRRTFNGVVPIKIDDETDQLTWNLTQLLDLMQND
jgi:hypothetical protein